MTMSSVSVNPKAILSPGEMFEIGLDISKKYSPVVAAKSSNSAKKVVLNSRELLEISTEITQKYTAQSVSKMPSLIVLPIDPEHLYISWNIGRSQINAIEKDNQQSIVLRIYPKPGDDLNTNRTKTWFDVDIDPTKNRQQITIPKGQGADTYTAAVGKLNREDQITVFAATKDIHIPRGNSNSFESPYIVSSISSSYQFLSSSQEKLHNTNNNASGKSIK